MLKKVLQDEAEDEEMRSNTSDAVAKRRRHISHTPSRTPPSSPDIRRTRAGSESDSESDAGRYISRSPSRSRSENGEVGDLRARFISHSRSVSPDRKVLAENVDNDQIEGDV